MPTRRTARPTALAAAAHAAIVAVLLTATGTAARAQSAPAAYPSAPRGAQPVDAVIDARTAPDAAFNTASNSASDDLPDDAVLSDTLFTGIALTRTQAQLIVSMAREQRVEREADWPVLMDAIGEIRRARDRGDETGAQRAIEMIRQSANLRRVWWMGAIRAVLTPTQRRTFDANLAATSDEPDAIGVAFARDGRR